MKNALSLLGVCFKMSLIIKFSNCCFVSHLTIAQRRVSYFGAIQKELESRGIEILSSGFERIPQITKKLTEAEMADVEKLIEKIEEDDDVMNVYHKMEE
mgnify:CR=1 FL=1